MKKPGMTTLFCMAILACSAAWSAEPAKAPLTAQQQKMKTCNAEAGTRNLAGDARAKFMKTCLSADVPAPNSQQMKMKTCNADADAKSLKGDARKQFMSSCLKGVP